jgi:hypothetical protein
MRQDPGVAVLHYYRITKYDPALRDDDGSFPADSPTSWTAFSDVGDVFGGTLLTLPTYLNAEATHLVVVASFIEEEGLASLVAQGVENANGGFRAHEGQKVTAAEAVEAVRQMLREEGWCRLIDDDRFYIHVGWDYYVYVGTSRPCEQSIRFAEARGLFVDRDFRSPYLDKD